MPHRSTRVTLLGRASLLFTLPLLPSVGCGGSTSEPKADDTQPASVVVVTEPARSAIVNTEAGDFVVKVANKAGAGLPGVPVTFTADLPGYLLFGPDSVTTDSTGLARTTVRMGVVTGARTAFASARGVYVQAVVPITVRPGPPAGFVLSPLSVRLYGAGDTLSFSAGLVDLFGNRSEVPATFQVTDSSLLAVTAPSTPDGLAKVRALKGGGNAQINIVGGDITGSLPVTVFQSQRNLCAGVAAPQVAPLGAVAVAT